MYTFRDPLLARGATSAEPQPDSGGASPARRRRSAPIALAGIAAALLVGLPVVLVGGATGVGALTPNLPVFPNNIMIFPNRDFITIEGYSEHAGESAEVTVTRPGVGVVGSAIGVVSGGDVAFEVNHPGGYCWGAGTGLNVTPDIQAGDVVSLSFGGTIEAATTTLDVYASDAVQNGTTVTVSGHIGAGVPQDQMEQRIIEPALVDTIVGKRDVRAVPGPLTPAPKGGYSSSLEFPAGTQDFLATYIFDDEPTAHIAANAGLGERAMAWEFTDADANRQGMTIAEFGEAGGPGVGGCPNGPLQSGPPGPTNVVAAKVPAGIKVNWTPAVAIPGTPAILGYEVTAVADSSINNERAESGKRISNPGASSTTIIGLVAGQNYDIEVVSVSSTGHTFPAVPASVVVDSTPPTVSASPNGGTYPIAQQVTLTANEQGSDIYYTTDTTDPVVGDQLGGPTVSHYTGPITVSEGTTLKFAAFDPSGNVSQIMTEEYHITNNPVPAATTFSTSSVGFNAVTLNWTAPDAGAPGLIITGFEINVFASAGATIPVKTQTTSGVVTTATIDGLTGDTPYWFTVSAQNNTGSGFGPASARLGPLTPQGLLVANAGFDQTGVIRNTKVTLSGAGSTMTGATNAWTQQLTGLQTAADLVPLTPDPVNPQNASFTLPLFKFPMVNSALTFQLAVTVGGVTKTDLVTVTPRSEAVSIGTAKWKPGDFRVVGTGTPGSVITVRTAVLGQIFGATTVDATGAFDFRLRTGVPTLKPAAIVAESNMGGTSAPFNIAG